jgi:2-iminobutanoate/2-iminopropanoate deaminase
MSYKTITNPHAGKGWKIFEGSKVNQLIHSDAVRIDFPDHSMIYVSGKTATDENGNVVGVGDMRAQTKQVFKNIGKILAENGATIDDIVRVRVYVQDLTRERFCEIHEARAEIFKQEHYPASTLVEVKSLVREGALIEVDADAVIMRKKS